MSQLDIAGVTKIYDPKTNPVAAVKSLDLSIDEGDIVALLGSSGCGKTSTLRMVAGFEDITRGTISIAGRDVSRLAPAARGIAMAFEGYSLYPPMTVRENIGFALQSARVASDEIARRVDDMAAMLGIESILDRYPSSISGGQQQRAGLARALIREADLHLLDEPMGQLEPQLRALLRGRIKHYLKERGSTAILVTHDQTEANALADRIAVMEDGVLQQYGTPNELRDRPANLFTGTFVGEPPMNVLMAKPIVEGVGDDGRVRLQLEGDVSLAYPLVSFSESVRNILAESSSIAIGIRPYAVRLSAGGTRTSGAGASANSASGTAARVVVNQWLGDQSHLAVEFADTTVVAVAHERVAGARGDTVHIAFSPDDLHWFEPDSGRALAHGREVAGTAGGSGSDVAGDKT